MIERRPLLFLLTAVSGLFWFALVRLEEIQAQAGQGSSQEGIISAPSGSTFGASGVRRGLGQPLIVEAYRGRSPSFRTPRGLRDRVDFWIDVFAKYGRHQVLVHHRHFPQAVFDVLDFRDMSQTMSESALRSFKDDTFNSAADKIYGVLSRFADGHEPADEYEQHIFDVMKKVPTPNKFRITVEEKLLRGQTGIRERFGEAIRRSGRYLPMMENVFVREHGLPPELTRLPFVESSFDYKAYSSVGAAGIWQFMPTTGRLFLNINRYVDERRDPVLATRAAAQYLKEGYRRLGSWALALTGYNHGTGGVARKVKEFGTSDIVALVEHPTQRVFGFASSNFFPEFLAALEVYENRTFYFPEIQLEPALRFIDVELQHPLSVRHVIRELGVSEDTLQDFNYAPSKLVWSGAAPLPVGYKLRIPAELHERAGRLLAPDPTVRLRTIQASNVYGGTSYKVRRGDTLAKIAKKYRTTPSNLRRLNGLKSEYVQVGRVLVVRPPSRTGAADVSVPATTGRTSHTEVTYVVKPGDTIYSIAQREGVSVSQIKSLNGLRSTKLRTGQVLRTRTEKREENSSKSETATASSPSSQSKGKKSAGAKAKKARSYKVRKGDTLSSISAKTGVSLKALRQANGIKGSSVQVGRELRIP